MNLQYALPALDHKAAVGAVGEPIEFSVPANLSLSGSRLVGWFVASRSRWAYIENGMLKASGDVAGGTAYKMVPLIGNVILECEQEGNKRILARASMEHAARYGFLAQALNDLSKGHKVRIYNTDDEPACPTCGGLLIGGTRVCPRCMNKAAAFKRLFRISRNHWRGFVFGLAILFGSSVLALVGPYFQRLLINGALQPPQGVEASLRLFMIAIIGMCLCLLLGEGFNMLRNRVMAGISSGIAADLRKMVFDKTQTLSLGFMTSQRAGDLMNRISQDTDQIRFLLQEIFSTAIYQLVMLTAASTLLFIADWRLAIVVLLPAPIVAYMHYYIWKYVLRRLFHKQWMVNDKANSFLHDVLSGIRVVKAFGKEEREIKRFRDYNAEFVVATIRSEKLYSILSPLTNYLIQIGQYFVLLLGCNLILGGEMSIGELIQFSAYAGMVFGPISWLMFMPRWIANAVVAIERIFSVIDEKPEVEDTRDPLPHAIKGDIRFEQVYFGYKSYEPVLKDINLHIKSGEMIGLVGHSGAGKSTLINLLSRFYDVNEGCITIDGTDIRDIKQSELRSQIGVVLQETFLFSGTITDNIRYAKPDATEQEIIEAARIANAHSFIIQMPDGYDTKLDENGNNLSGGERQRIAIARAVLNNPKLLILDEATAALDIDTESAIQEALQRITTGRTTVVIAHRLSTLRHADRLVALDKGRIAEVGSHAELMDKKGIYYHLINAQREMSRRLTTIAE